MFSCMFLIPEVSTNKPTSENEVQEFINGLEIQYGTETLKLSFFSIEELRPYAILQNESTVAKYSNNWVTPIEYLSSLDIDEKQQINSRIFEYVNDFEDKKRLKLYSKITNYLYSYTVIENLLISSEDKYKLKIFRTLRQLDVTKQAFDHISTMGEFEVADLNKNELNQAKVMAYNKLANLDDQSRLIYYSEFFKNISNM